MKRCIFPILIALLAMTVGSCNFSKPDYSTLSKSELKKLDEQGDAQASLQLGRMAIKDMDRSSAKKYFTKAADQNIPEGLHNLAIINFFEGDSIAGFNNLERAVDMDFIPSKGYLAVRLLDNSSYNRTIEGARLAKEASDAGDKLGFLAMHLHQVIIQDHKYEDGDKAHEYLKQSIQAGCGYALCVRYNELLRGNNSDGAIYADIEQYSDQFPVLAGEIVRKLNGDPAAMTDPYFKDGYFIIEDFMQ